MVRNLIVCIVSFVMLNGCNDDEQVPGSSSVNDFVWKGLNSWYFWKAQVPNLHDQRFSTQDEYQGFISGRDPENLFYSLLYDYPQTDRFSWIVDDVEELMQSFSGVQLSSGMDFTLAYTDQSAGLLVGMVNYVIPDSPAAAAGIQRGDIFYQINGMQLHTSNYDRLYAASFNLTFATEAEMSSGGLVLSGARHVQLNSLQLEENPVHHAQIYRDGGQTTGYLVYNAFRANYNDELNDVMADFVSQGVNDLILDLRYNSGGSIVSALVLGQMITGQFSGQNFVSLEYNQNHNYLNVDYGFEPEMTVYSYVNDQNVSTGTENVQSLGLNRLYVLTTGNTASASELVISSLRPYIDVTVIGARTSGKFVGSRTLVDHPASDFMDYNNRNMDHSYAMQPIVFAYYNSENQIFNQGIDADYQVNFSQYIGRLGEFGDVQSDPALAQALSLIGGNTQRIIPEEIYPVQRFVTEQEKRHFSRELYVEPE